MIPLSESMLAAVRGPARFRVDVHVDDDLVGSTDADAGAAVLYVAEASLASSLTQPTRHTFNAQFGSAAATVPASLTDAFSPLSNTTLTVSFVHGDEVATWRQFRADEAEWVRAWTSDGPGGVYASITGRDVTKALADLSTPEAITVASGTRFAAAAADLIRTYDPGATIVDTAGNATAPAQWQRPRFSSILAAVVDLASAGGFVAYGDPSGRWMLEAPPVIADEPVVTWEAGDGLLLAATAAISRAGTVNGVHVKGDQDGAVSPVEATVWVSDAGSPLFFDGTSGPVGPMPVSVTDVTLTSVQACTERGRQLLDTVAGVPRVVTLETVVDPRIDVGDTVGVEAAELGLSGLFMVGGIGYQLGQASQTLTLVPSRAT